MLKKTLLGISLALGATALAVFVLRRRSRETPSSGC